jgi:hypothetical protein
MIQDRSLATSNDVQKHLTTKISTEELATLRVSRLNEDRTPSYPCEAVKPCTQSREETCDKMDLNSVESGSVNGQNSNLGPSSIDSYIKYVEGSYNPRSVDSPVKVADVFSELRSYIDCTKDSNLCHLPEDAEVIRDSILRFKIPSVSELKEHLRRPAAKKLSVWLQHDRYFSRDRYGEERIMPALIPLWGVLKDVILTASVYGYRCVSKDLYARLVIVFIHWCILASHIDYNWIKVAKYKLAAFASYAKGSNVYPVSPFGELDNPAIIFDKQLKIYTDLTMGRKALSARLFHMSLVDSICRGIKKGADRPSQLDCHNSCVATVKLFTRADKPKLTFAMPHQGYNSDLYDSLYPELRPVFGTEEVDKEIRRSIKELLRDAGEFKPTYSHVPSFSSGTEAPLKNGGQCKVVKESIGYKDHPLYRCKVKEGLFDGSKVKAVRPSTEDKDPILRPRDVSLEETLSPSRCKYVELDTGENLKTTDSLDIETLIVKCLNEDSVIHPIGLAEALKVRGITTPNPLETWLLQPLQKFLAKALLRFKCFTVTGQPLKAEHLNDVFSGTSELDGPFVSGDYDNATNEMNSCYTRTAIRFICECLELSPLYRRLAERSLCDNIITYTWTPEGEVAYDSEVTQTIGGQQLEAQPMGKILSFVVLCIINFSMCRKALELDQQKKISMRDFPGLINGDDCCFRIKKFETWVGTTACVGLFNSIGKTFYSTEFVEMNSRSFIYDNGSFYETPFINFGLVRMMKRSEQGNGTTVSVLDTTIKDIINLGPCHTDLVKGLDFIYNEVDLIFKYTQHHLLTDHRLDGIPYYVPQWLGGLGMDPGSKPETKVTINHRQVAYSIYKNIKEEPVLRINPGKNCTLNDLVNETFKNILGRKNISRQVAQTTTSEFMIDQEGRFRNFEEENQAIYNKILELLWKNNPLAYFFSEPSVVLENAASRLAWRRLNKTQSLWKIAYTKVHSRSKVLPWHKLWHQTKIESYPVVQLRANTIVVGNNCLLS